MNYEILEKLLEYIDSRMGEEGDRFSVEEELRKLVHDSQPKDNAPAPAQAEKAVEAMVTPKLDSITHHTCIHHNDAQRAKARGCPVCCLARAEAAEELVVKFEARITALAKDIDESDDDLIRAGSRIVQLETERDALHLLCEKQRKCLEEAVELFDQDIEEIHLKQIIQEDGAYVGDLSNHHLVKTRTRFYEAITATPAICTTELEELRKETARLDWVMRQLIAGGTSALCAALEAHNEMEHPVLDRKSIDAAMKEGGK